MPEAFVTNKRGAKRREEDVRGPSHWQISLPEEEGSQGGPGRRRGEREFMKPPALSCQALGGGVDEPQPPSGPRGKEGVSRNLGVSRVPQVGRDDLLKVSKERGGKGDEICKIPQLGEKPGVDDQDLAL